MWWYGRAKDRMTGQEDFVNRPLYRKGILCNQDDEEDTRSQEEELHWRRGYVVNLQFSHSVVSNSLWPLGLQHTRLPCPSPSLGACSNSCPLSQRCHPTISSSVVLFSSSLPSIFPSIRVFSKELAVFIKWPIIGGSASVLPVNIQDWFPLGLTCWISLQSKGLPRVFSNTTVKKHQFFSAQLFLWSCSHIHTWLLEKL